jgi:outer membrane protease
MHFTFTGKDGYYKYSEYNQGQFSGDVINYKQDWFLAAAGFSVETNIFAPFTIDLSLQISPLTYCIALDEHIDRKTFFSDYTSMGLFFEPKLNLGFNINRINIMFDVAYRHIGKTRGKSYHKYTGQRYETSQNESGAGLSVFDASFLVRINIGN